MSSRRKAIPTDSLLQLRQRLDRLPPKSPERAAQITAMALLYCISVTTVYRTLRAFQKPHIAHRRDHGKPRILPPSELEYYCELIAALKLRTTNKAGRHLSTTRAIQLLEEHGVETTQGLVKLPKGWLTAICPCSDSITHVCYGSHRQRGSRLSAVMTAGSSICRPLISNISNVLSGLIRPVDNLP